ncbi:hypothetical protein KK101_05370 [Curtobacterium flaccumfaciens pv. oortii]|uniref:hypothetical protein n=1 Tax=Curtobacterium flaccumfaciens TaxID=2035 RepID=UPI001BDEEA1F|nr:hypothetical protein [Curtobacterium flaccumfaciens]MBT1622115.1 hypothetical protein [Curtobacterium flaccumfaciens pv. oortii]
MARWRLRDELRKSFAAAADAGGVDMYSFEGEVQGIRLPMSFSVSVAHLGASVGMLPLETFAAGLSTSGDTQVVDFPAGRMIRTERRSTEPAGAGLRRTGSTGDDAGALSAANQAAVRALHGFAADHADVEVAQTTVDYLVPIPGEVGTFVVVSLVAPGASDVEARVGHFDLLMAGFGWTG